MVNRIYTRLNARRPAIEKSEEYADGKQPLSFATEEWRKANAARYDGFSDNWCGPVITAEAERLSHTGIKMLGDNGTEAARILWEQWLLNEMEMQSSQGFVTSLTTGRSFVSVWGDKNDQPQVTWEHPSNVEIEYDWENPRLRKAALKTWLDETTEYATLYTADALWKFERPRERSKDDRESQAQQGRVKASADDGWIPREVSGETWPLNNPIGDVPVVEIPNRPRLGGDPLSEIAGVIPMQDFINLLWAYLALSADYASMPARVVLHQGPPKMPILDSNGQKIGEKAIEIKDLAEKRLLYLSGEDTAIDSWAAADLKVFTDAIEIGVGHIASQTRTPPTYLISKTGMSNVNGEGLKASEIGLVKKTMEFQRGVAPALREVYRLIALALGDQALARQARLSTISWASAEIRSDAQLADALVKLKSIGFPLEYLMELYGLGPVEIERILAMREQELLDPQLAAATRELTHLGNAPFGG
nr:phage portal protein [Leifsonia psychrotolerans]